MNAHIIAIPMTSVGLHGGFRGNVWYKHRIEVFKNYTLKSLANQTNKDFFIWMWFRPEEKDNPLTQEIARAIEVVGLKYIFTFDGLMYYDDKFTDYTVKTKIRNLLMMVWDMWKYKEWKSPRELWRHTWENKNETLLSRLDLSLRQMEKEITTDYHWVYMTRIDSDDMFHEEVVNLIQSQQPAKKKALVFDKGFIYNIITGQLGTWEPKTNPPFYTIIFPVNVFFAPWKHVNYYGSFTTHEDIPQVFDCTTLDMDKYMVTFHSKHISTAWDQDIIRRARDKVRGYCYTTSGRNISTHWQSHARKVKNSMIGKEITDYTTKKQILQDFGISI